MPLTTSWRLFGSTPPLGASIAGNDGTEALILSNGKFNFERGLTVKRSLLLSLKNKGSPKVSGSNLCNVGCLIVITPPNFFYFIFFGGGQPSYNNFWESIAGIMICI